MRKIIEDVFRNCLYGINIVSTPQEGERLMQVADFVSSLKLLDLKLTRMEKDIIGAERDTIRKYIKPSERKEFMKTNGNYEF